MNKTESSVYCRWLHLSDLHFISSSNDKLGHDIILYGTYGPSRASNAHNLDEGGLNWAIQQSPVDCIVISGDFLLQGNFNESVQRKLKDFLQEIYAICNTANNWGWDREKPMDRLFWCPGNHDLNRDVVMVEEEHPIYRKDLIQNASDESGYFHPGSYGSLLTEKTFYKIYNFMRELRGDSLEDNNYEAKLFFVPDLRDPPICFIAINTALSAGQICRKDVSSDVEKYFNDFFKYHNTQDAKSALQAYQSYYNCLQIQRHEIIEDEHHLCFISEGQAKQIQRMLNSQNRYIAFLVGHHPFYFFNKAARDCFRIFINSNAISLYLHGHTHVVQRTAPTNAGIPIDDDSKIVIPSIGVGGLFLNSTEEYNQLSFSIGSILKTDSDTFSCEVNLYVFAPKTYNDRQWTVLASPICASCNIGSSGRSKESAASSDVAEDPMSSPNSQKKILEGQTKEENDKIDGNKENIQQYQDSPTASSAMQSITEILNYYNTHKKKDDSFMP